MRVSTLERRGFGTVILSTLLIVLTALASGCVVYEPVVVPSYSGSSYDRVWDSALGAAEDAGVRITSADRTRGTIRGNSRSAEVTITVMSQADGSTRVEFSSKGPKGQDPDLNERFTYYYNRRMGR